MSDDGEWSKAERLAVACAVAPTLRSQSDKTKSRRVARVDADGKVVGYTTLGEVQKALLRTREIELEVVDGVRPKEVICRACGKTVKVRPQGPPPRVCYGGCRGACVECGCLVSAATALRAAVERREPYCKACTSRRRQAALTVEQRSERARKGVASMTPDQRKMRSRNYCPEQLRAALSKRWLQSAEQRAENKVKKLLTPEQRSDACRQREAKKREGRSPRVPSCHPDRPYLAKGLCSACYHANRAAEAKKAEKEAAS